MENSAEDLNRFQIIRKDAKGCFVETKSDRFGIGKVHLEFATYDAKRPEGQRQTNHVHIYVDISEFLHLTHEALSGALHMRARQQKEKNDNTPLFEHLGGTPAKRLTEYGRARTDGKSLSRIVRLLPGESADYRFQASSGPAETDAKGLIVPQRGKSSEAFVSVALSWRSLNELLLMTQAHYQAWLAAQYIINPSLQPPNGSHSQP